MFRRLFSLSILPNSRTYARGRPSGVVNQFTHARPSARQQPQRFADRLPDDDPTDPGQYEADFNQLAHSQRVHSTEQAAERERIKHRIVGTKYFRTVSPNFLTWAEKEQIRRLHAADPDEWPVERLVESFPADDETVAKLVRARWLPRDAKRIAKHDAAVREAWQAFDAGEVGDMDEALRSHLQKFGGGRSAVPVEATVPGVAVEKRLPKLAGVRDDFTKILTSCRKYKSIEAGANVSEQSSAVGMPPALVARGRPVSDEEGTFLLGKVNKTKAMMYHELDEVSERDKIGQVAAAKNAHNPFQDPRRVRHATSDFDDDTYTDAMDEPESDVSGNRSLSAGARHHSHFPQPASQQDAIVSKYDTTEMQASDADLRRLSMPAIRDQITIPAKLWRRGATYKLADCYYDDDGEFLYRVPGMTGK